MLYDYQTYAAMLFAIADPRMEIGSDCDSPKALGESSVIIATKLDVWQPSSLWRIHDIWTLIATSLAFNDVCLSLIHI